MAEEFRCNQCDKGEGECRCDRYCIICQGQHNIRLTKDGSYYCLECREACDLQAQ